MSVKVEHDQNRASVSVKVEHGETRAAVSVKVEHDDENRASVSVKVEHDQNRAAVSVKVEHGENRAAVSEKVEHDHNRGAERRAGILRNKSLSCLWSHCSTQHTASFSGASSALGTRALYYFIFISKADFLFF